MEFLYKNVSDINYKSELTLDILGMPKYGQNVK
jgi:hypothetical protein